MSSASNSPVKNRVVSAFAILGSAASLFLVASLVIAPNDATYESNSLVDYVALTSFAVAILVGVLIGLLLRRPTDTVLLCSGSFLFLSGAVLFLIGGFVVMPVGLALQIAGFLRAVRFRLIPFVRRTIGP